MIFIAVIGKTQEAAAVPSTPKQNFVQLPLLILPWKGFRRLPGYLQNGPEDLYYFYQNLLTALHLVSPVKRFHSNIYYHDKLLKTLDAKIHRASREYRKSRDSSLLILINKLSADRELLRVSLERQEEGTVLSVPPNPKSLSRLFRRRCIPNKNPIACLRFTGSGLVTDPVNIAEHLNAYFASCYLPIPANSKPLLTAASLHALNGQGNHPTLSNVTIA
ncbi:hypothetical protein CLF_107799 [Clonorchis sinensis]|uniref:Uncharacterized protein n=1 Tax=Clonorchis sinensis TaxID=79923 RepID=G7YR12_CLOSI|nr:hypothetical protein CLF_107799 [Clonorchis sinensis]